MTTKVVTYSQFFMVELIGGFYLQNKEQEYSMRIFALCDL